MTQPPLFETVREPVTTSVLADDAPTPPILPRQGGRTPKRTSAESPRTTEVPPADPTIPPDGSAGPPSPVSVATRVHGTTDTGTTRGLALTEGQLLARIRDLANLTGWLPYHTHNSKFSEPGFPDLVIAHRGRRLVVFAELKDAKRKATAAQQHWLDTLSACGMNAYLWRPADWPEIERLLRGAA